MNLQTSAQGAPDVFNAWGFDQNRDYFSELPFEHIDPMTGNLLLTFTDLVLPGNASFNLRIQRTYNSKIFRDYPSQVINEDSWVGIGWRMHIARVRNPLVAPIIEMSDGSTHPTFTHVDGSGRHITKDYWIYNLGNPPFLELPNGMKYTFGYSLAPPELGLVYYVTKIEDPYGNEVVVEYGNGTNAPADGITKITQKFGSESRVITFEYDDAIQRSLKRMILSSGSTHIWTFVQTRAVSSINQSLLKEVKPPAGPAWKYDYGTTPGSLKEELTKVTMPNGGTFEYKYKDQLFYMPGTSAPITSRVVGQRTTGGRDIPPGTWTYAYALGPEKNRSEFISPCNKTTYAFMGIGQSGIGLPAWQTGVLASKVIQEGSTVLEAESFEWIPSDRISFDDVIIGFNHDPEVYVPLVHKRTVIRGNKSYVTTNTYRKQNFNDYGRPEIIQEDGDLSRTIRRTFQYGFTRYIVDKIGSETVTVAGESFSKSFTYDLANGFKKSETIYGIRTEYTMDTSAQAKGNVQTVKERSIHPSGTVSWVKRRGHTTYFEYDPSFRVTRILPPVGDPSIVEYDNSGGTFYRVKRGPSLRETKLDGSNRVSGTEDSVGVKTDVTYDACGRTVYESYPFTGNNIGTRFVYDGLGRVKEKRNPDDTLATYAYPNGIDVHIRDEALKLTIQHWAAFGDPGEARLLQLTDATNKTWTYDYNALGRLRSVSAPSGGPGPLRTWRYNDKNQLFEEAHPESGTVKYTYDNAGNLQTKTDPTFGLTIFTYDGNNRLRHADRPGTAYDTSFDFDASDNLTRLENTYVRSTFIYDPANRLEQRTDVVSSQTFITVYGYDGRDNIRRIDYPSGRSAIYDYDSENRISAVKDGADVPLADAFTYHPSGAIASFHSRNGLNHTFQHDNRYRLKNIFDSGSVLNLEYIYDNVSNVRQITDVRPGMNQTYEYDDLHRLGIANGFWGAGSFDYDAVGNRRTKKIADMVTTYVHDLTSNRLVSASGAEEDTFTYDGNGNLKSSSTASFAYTPENMLETAVISGAVTTYRYDGHNVRTLKLNQGTAQYYIHGPGERLISEFTAAEGQQGQWVRDYIYAGSRLIATVNNPDLPALTSMADCAVALPDVSSPSTEESVVAVAEEPATSFPTPTLTATEGVRYYHLDALGSVRAVTDESRVVVERYDYLPYGEEWHAQPSSNLIRFTGKERDTETGLDYFGARYYGSKIGRFTTIDPAHTWQDNLVDPQRWNRYTYAINNPLRYMDPDGKAALDIISGVANAIGSNFFLGAGRTDSNNSDFALGQSIGDAASVVLGMYETMIGLGAIASGSSVGGGGLLATATGMGALLGIPATAGGALIAAGGAVATVHGVGVSTSGLSQLINSFMKSKGGSGKSKHPGKERTLEGAQDQLESIEATRDAHIKHGQPERINKTRRSQNELDAHLKKVKSLKDAIEAEGKK